MSPRPLCKKLERQLFKQRKKMVDQYKKGEFYTNISNFQEIVRWVEEREKEYGR